MSETKQLTVERFFVNDAGRESGAWSRGNLRERLRIVDGKSSADGPVIAEMVFGGRALADLFAAAPEMLEAHRWLMANAAEHSPWLEDHARHCPDCQRYLNAYAAPPPA